MTSAFRLKRSEIRSGRSSSRPSADRYSILRFCPSTYPYSRSPARKSASSVLSALLKGDSTPTIGTVRCAHASRGAEIAAPPRATTNSRRFIASPDAQEMARILAGNVEDGKGTRRKLRKAHWLRCPGWVKSRPQPANARGPLSDQQRTCAEVAKWVFRIENGDFAYEPVRSAFFRRRIDHPTPRY